MPFGVPRDSFAFDQIWANFDLQGASERLLRAEEAFLTSGGDEGTALTASRWYGLDSSMGSEYNNNQFFRYQMHMYCNMDNLYFYWYIWRRPHIQELHMQ